MLTFKTLHRHIVVIDALDEVEISGKKGGFEVHIPLLWQAPSLITICFDDMTGEKPYTEIPHRYKLLWGSRKREKNTIRTSCTRSRQI
jgi:hypothetical protein